MRRQVRHGRRNRPAPAFPFRKTDRTARTRYWRPKSPEDVVEELRLRAQSARLAAFGMEAVGNERFAAALRGKATGLTQGADLLAGYLERQERRGGS